MAEIVYSYLPPEGDITRHIWTATGNNGAVHVWAEPTAPLITHRWGDLYYGGIEIHSRKPLYDFGSQEPSHSDCWLLKCPCWHDGSSLQFSEQVEPFLREAELPFGNHVHEYVNAIMFDWYKSRFAAEEVQ